MKKVAVFLFLTVFFALVFTFKASAQTVPAQTSTIWKCLRGDSQNLTFNGASNSTVTQSLYADGFTTDTVYLVACIGTANGSLCTTGDPAYDRLIMNSDNTTTFPYKVTFTGGSKQTTNLGKVSSSVTISTAGITGGLSFFAVAVGDIKDLVGAGPALKQSTFTYGDSITTKCVTISWTTVFPPPPVSSSSNNNDHQPATGMDAIYQCLRQHRCRWDPFGIVFDSQSLVPLPNVTVTILDSNKVKYNLVGLTNPQKTQADGLFNFLVEPGTYYLEVSQPAGYAFTASPNLQPNYIKIYHKEDGTNSIYKPGDPVAEIIDTPDEIANGAPNMEHRDIPLDPGLNTPYNPEPTTVSYSAESYGNLTTINGKVSLPFTYVTASQGNTQIKKIQADRFGYYEFILDNAKLQPDQDIVVSYEKVDLTTINIVSNLKKYFSRLMNLVLATFSYPTKAQTHIKIDSPSPTVQASATGSTGFSISPILSYIEGFAYDNGHNVIPKATVLVKLNMNNAIYYKTVSDDKGYFIIYPKNIPLFPYYLEIIPPNGGPIKYSTSQFAKDNKVYLTEAKINLSNATKDNIPVATDSANGSFSQLDPRHIAFQNSTTPTPVKKAIANSKGSTTLLFMSIILLCLIIAGIIIFTLLKNRGGMQLQI